MKNCSRLLDRNFDKINELRWYPWIGENYPVLTDNRLLVIGESHYYLNKSLKIECELNKFYTRGIVIKEAINRSIIGVNMFSNFHKALINNDEFDSRKLWSNACFYNFIQRPMSFKGQPSTKDFKDGWPVFAELIKIIKPNTCIFIGVTASCTFEKMMDHLNIPYSPIRYKNKLNSCYPRVSEIRLKEPIKIVFIKHSSSYFSWPCWNKFLRKQLPEQIKRLNQYIR